MPVSLTYHTSLLNAVSRYFEGQGYRLVHQHRLSKQLFMGNELYHGLTQVEDTQQKAMIKWQLQDLTDTALEHQRQGHCDTPLAIEIQHLQRIAAVCDGDLFKSSHGLCCITPIQKISTTQLIIEDKPWQLTGFRMPYYPRGSIKEYLNKHPISDEQKMQLLQMLAQSVSDLHQLGWIHGDIKPSNFLLADDEDLSLDANKMPKQKTHNKRDGLSVVVTDLAYAVELDKRCDDTKDRYHPRGTAAYLAPECWQGRRISVQSDIYAFGIMMYEILMGVRPFQITQDSGIRSVSTDWAMAHCQREVPLLSKQGSYLQSVIDRLLAKRLQNRFQSMDQVIKALAEA